MLANKGQRIDICLSFASYLCTSAHTRSSLSLHMPLIHAHVLLDTHGRAHLVRRLNQYLIWSQVSWPLLTKACTMWVLCVWDQYPVRLLNPTPRVRGSREHTHTAMRAQIKEWGGWSIDLTETGFKPPHEPIAAPGVKRIHEKQAVDSTPLENLVKSCDHKHERERGWKSSEQEIQNDRQETWATRTKRQQKEKAENEEEYAENEKPREKCELMAFAVLPLP